MECEFIQLIRDARDAELSFRGLWFGPGDDIEAQARFWVDEALNPLGCGLEIKTRDAGQ